MKDTKMSFSISTDIPISKVNNAVGKMAEELGCWDYIALEIKTFKTIEVRHFTYELIFKDEKEEA